MLDIKNSLKNPNNPVKSIVSLQLENAQLIKELDELKKEQAKQIAIDLKTKMTLHNDILFLAEKTSLDVGSMKNLAFELGEKEPNAFIILGSETDGKAMLLCYISKDLVAKKGLDAGKIVRELGKYIEGSGGGQPFFATAGGKKVDGIEKALKEAIHFI